MTPNSPQLDVIVCNHFLGTHSRVQIRYLATYLVRKLALAISSHEDRPEGSACFVLKVSSGTLSYFQFVSAGMNHFRASPESSGLLNSQYDISNIRRKHEDFLGKNNKNKQTLNNGVTVS